MRPRRGSFAPDYLLPTVEEEGQAAAAAAAVARERGWVTGPRDEPDWAAIREALDTPLVAALEGAECLARRMRRRLRRVGILVSPAEEVDSEEDVNGGMDPDALPPEQDLRPGCIEAWRLAICSLRRLFPTLLRASPPLPLDEAADGLSPQPPPPLPPGTQEADDPPATKEGLGSMDALKATETLVTTGTFAEAVDAATCASTVAQTSPAASSPSELTSAVTSVSTRSTTGAEDYNGVAWSRSAVSRRSRSRSGFRPSSHSRSRSRSSDEPAPDASTSATARATGSWRDQEQVTKVAAATAASVECDVAEPAAATWVEEETTKLRRARRRRLVQWLGRRWVGGHGPATLGDLVEGTRACGQALVDGIEDSERMGEMAEIEGGLLFSAAAAAAAAAEVAAAAAAAAASTEAAAGGEGAPAFDNVALLQCAAAESKAMAAKVAKAAKAAVAEAAKVAENAAAVVAPPASILNDKVRNVDEEADQGPAGGSDDGSGGRGRDAVLWWPLFLDGFGDSGDGGGCDALEAGTDGSLAGAEAMKQAPARAEHKAEYGVGRAAEAVAGGCARGLTLDLRWVPAQTWRGEDWPPPPSRAGAVAAPATSPTHDPHLACPPLPAAAGPAGRVAAGGASADSSEGGRGHDEDEDGAADDPPGEGRRRRRRRSLWTPDHPAAGKGAAVGQARWRKDSGAPDRVGAAAAGRAACSGRKLPPWTLPYPALPRGPRPASAAAADAPGWD